MAQTDLGEMEHLVLLAILRLGREARLRPDSRWTARAFVPRAFVFGAGVTLLASGNYATLDIVTLRSWKLRSCVVISRLHR